MKTIRNYTSLTNILKRLDDEGICKISEFINADGSQEICLMQYVNPESRPRAYHFYFTNWIALYTCVWKVYAPLAKPKEYDNFPVKVGKRGRLLPNQLVILNQILLEGVAK